MVLWRAFDDGVVNYLEDDVPLMMGVGSGDDFACLQIYSNNSWTLDVALMSLEIVDTS
jgi:hypothetical protein